MKLLFDNGPELVVWRDNDKLVLNMGGVECELEGSDLMHFAMFVESHKRKVLDDQEKRMTLFQKIKLVWRPIH